ncbi:MAG: magnesium and cobalt transport protein CorA [Verrucomicrobia bacterium]|nr:MAG: magnesium and cobalt transport protein CorA [Verrucomicrobiota bacterium]
MIQSFILSDGKVVGRDLEIEALRLVRGDKGLVLWVNLASPTPEETKAILEGVFQFHPLAIEDCVAPSSMPKIEDYEEYLFLVMHAVDFNRTDKFTTTELNLFLGREFLVTFHPTPLKSVSAVLEKCAKATGIVARGPDRIAHFLLDGMVDNYKPVVDEFRAELEEIEEDVLEGKAKDLTARLLAVRSELNTLRTAIRPQRELAARLAHGESKIIRPVMLPYFRDLRDNLVRIEELATGQTDQLLISFDLHLSRSDFEANEGIKVLTAITAISLPATLIGTWYGMNFTHMPELHGRHTYPVVAAITLGLTFLVFRWCKRRGLI